MGYGGSLVLAGKLSAGDLTGFLIYSLLMAVNVSSLSGTYTEIMKSIAAAGRLFEIIDRVPQTPSSLQTSREIQSIDKSRSTTFERRKPLSIKFEGAGFAYPARPDALVIGLILPSTSMLENILRWWGGVDLANRQSRCY